MVMIFKEDPNYLTLPQNLLSCVYYQFVMDSIGVFLRKEWTGTKREMMDGFPNNQLFPAVAPGYSPTVHSNKTQDCPE